jgi:hypothetical protein
VTRVLLAAALSLMALLLVGLGLVPFAAVLPGGRDDPGAMAALAAWGSGSAVVIGFGVVFAILDRRLGVLARAPWRGVAAWTTEWPRLTGLLAACAATALYAWIARAVFSGHALLIDEVVQALQARIFTEGRLARPVLDDPAFTSVPLMVDRGGVAFGQFPPGWPAVLALFELLDARWLAGPIVSGAGIAAAWWWLRAVEPHAATRVLALVFTAAAPFFVFQAGTQMNHAPAVAALLLGLAGTAHALVPAASPAARRAGVVGGLGFGLAATTRPVDALCFALPAAAWWLWTVWHDRSRWRDMVLAGVAVVVPVTALLAFNAATTGAPLTFGYVYHWGAAHSLGFHESPYRVPHTPTLGLELVSLYLFRLNRVLLEWPLPALLPVTASLLLAARLVAAAAQRGAASDRTIAAADLTSLAGGVLLLAAYFAYFHDGWYLGPRFVLPLVPLLALWLARLPRLVAAAWPGVPTSAVIGTYAASAVIGAWTMLPIEYRNYQQGLSTMRVDGVALAREAGVRDALVFVRESWGATLIARLWARGIRPGDVEWLYKRADQCALDDAVTTLEARGVHGDAALSALTPLTADSLRVRPLDALIDRSGRFDPARPLSPYCQAQIARERAGYTLLAPRLLDRSDNVYARELGARDTLLLARYPSRPVFVLAPSSADMGAPLVFTPVSREALLAAARRGE